jgi:hypothetical protein
LSLGRPGINYKEVHVGFAVDKVALEQVYEYFDFPLSIDPSVPKSFNYHPGAKPIGLLKVSVPQTTS